MTYWFSVGASSRERGGEREREGRGEGREREGKGGGGEGKERGEWKQREGDWEEEGRERRGGRGTSLQQEVHRASTTKLKCMRCPPVTHEGNDTVCLLTAVKLQLQSCLFSACLRAACLRAACLVVRVCP